MDESSRTEQTTIKTSVTSSIERCFEVAADLESYPDWVDEIESIEISELDSQNRPMIAEFRAQSFGRKIRYKLQYDYSKAPNGIYWALLESDMIKRLDGSYEFQSLDEGSETEVTYKLAIELAVSLPGFVKRRAEEKVVDSALADYKSRVEKLN